MEDKTNQDPEGLKPINPFYDRNQWTIEAMIARPKERYPLRLIITGATFEECMTRLMKRCPDGTLLGVSELRHKRDVRYSVDGATKFAQEWITKYRADANVNVLDVNVRPAETPETPYERKEDSSDACDKSEATAAAPRSSDNQADRAVDGQ